MIKQLDWAPAQLDKILDAYQRWIVQDPDAPLLPVTLPIATGMRTMQFRYTFPSCLRHRDAIMHSLPEDGNLLTWKPPAMWQKCRDCLPVALPVTILDPAGKPFVQRWVYPDIIVT